VLARAQALTTQDPFHAYNAPTVAGPVGLQQTALNSVSGLDAGALQQQGTNLTTQGANYDPTTPQFGLEAAQQYMNPYQTQVTDLANQEAARNSQIQGTYDESKAAASGAFGGSRQGVVDAERERNLGVLQNNNTLQGQAAAYASAQQQFNADQNRQQQAGQYSSQAALQGGQNLTSQGAQAFTQQELAGGQQQAQAQGFLDQNKANFQGAVQHPYDQLSYMDGMITSMPGSSTLSNSSYTPDQSGLQPNGVQQTADTLGGLAGIAKGGMDLWSGIKGLFNNGGPVHSGLPPARIAQMYGRMAS
jgi:hypothetical protein